VPADRLLRASQGRIIGWWQAAYTQAQALVRERFWLEAASSLPRVITANESLDDVFDAVCLQRMKLKNDQQVPEWAGERYVV